MGGFSSAFPMMAQAPRASASVNPSAFGGAGAGGGMVGLGQLLQLLQNAFKSQVGQFGGMNAPNTAGAPQSNMGMMQLARRGNQSLMPSVQGAPQMDYLNPQDVAPAAANSAGGMQSLGGLLAPSLVGQRKTESRAPQSFLPQAYGGGITGMTGPGNRVNRSSWSPLGPQGPKTFALTTK